MNPRQSAPLLDLPLLTAVVMLCGISLIALYSAGGESLDFLLRQGARIALAFALLLIFAHIAPATLQRWSPLLYFAGLALLAVVLGVGISGGGAQRWLEVGGFRFQPAEVMKLVLPMMLAWLISRRGLPPSPGMLFLAIVVVMTPVVLVTMQPDLGTAILIFLAGMTVIFLGGISWKWVTAAAVSVAAALPVLWIFVLHDYQRSRIATLFNPWNDPLGAGYHTIQSVIAIGSGSFWGKGWLLGTQSQLEFIPERSTDFIFVVFAEEFGFVGAVLLLALYLFVCIRGLVISFNAADSYSRLLGGCLSITFFFYVFVNISMTVGILPVVGAPLPLMSHGGSAMLTVMAGLGILMSIQRHRKMTVGR